MSLATRLTAFANAVGADIKDLRNRASVTYGYQSSGAGTAVSPANTWKTVPIPANSTATEPAGAFTRNADGSITVRDAGWYQINTTVHIATPNLFQVTIGTAPDAPGSLAEDYSLQNIEQMATPSCAVKLAAGTKIYITIYTASTNAFVREFSIAGIGPQGPQGVKGDTGGNATVPMDPWHVVGAAGEPAFGAPFGSYQTVGFRKDPLGRVHLKGLAVTSGAAFAFGVRLFTLPAGYTPAAIERILVEVTEPNNNKSICQLQVAVNGAVTLAAYVVGTATSGAAGTYVSLDEVEFDTESVTQMPTGPQGPPGGVNALKTLDWNTAIAANFYRSTNDFLEKTLNGPGDTLNPPPQAGIVSVHENGAIAQRVWDLDKQVSYTRFRAPGGGAWSAWAADLVKPPVLADLIVGAPNPVDGDERYFQNAAMKLLGVMWKFRYNSASTNTSKWEFVGGSKWGTPMVGDITTASTADVSLTSGPSLTVPLAGDYTIALRCSVISGANPSGWATVTVYKDGVATLISTAIVFIGNSNGQLVVLNDEGSNIALTNGQVLTVKVSSANAANNRFANARISLVPVRVNM